LESQKAYDFSIKRSYKNQPWPLRWRNLVCSTGGFRRQQSSINWP
jgi:hypothetical protein